MPRTGYRATGWRLAIAITAICTFGRSSDAPAQTLTEYPLPTAGTSAFGIAAGPDGALWFTEYVYSGIQSTPDTASKIGRIATDGTITEFALPSASSAPDGIVAGPDGALWFVETGSNKIGRITTDGTITEFAIPFSSGTIPKLGTITAGSDGALWFPEGYIDIVPGTTVIGRITTDGTITNFTIPNGGAPMAIAAGPDGALWVTASPCCAISGSIIDQLTAAGVGKVFGVPVGSANGITAGPDGALWVIGDQIGRVTTSGMGKVVADNIVGPVIAVGPDGAFWSGVGGSIERVTTTGANTSFPILTSSNGIEGIVAGPDGAMWFTVSSPQVQGGKGGTGKIGRVAVPASTSPLVAAVLPSSRSVQTGATATAFATIINSGTGALTGCAIAPVTSVPASFLYQTTIASDNALTGTVNTPVTIPAGGSQSFFFAFTANAPFVPTDTVLGFDCANTDAAVSVSGLNTILLSGSTMLVPDVIALCATPSGDGTLHIPGSKGSAAFAVATANVGAGGQMTFTVDTGPTVLPLTLGFCPTDPTTGLCTATPATAPPGSGEQTLAAVGGGPATPASSVPITINAGATPTFSIFATATGSIPFAPQTNRIFVRFFDSSGAQRGSTSVAVSTQ